MFTYGLTMSQPPKAGLIRAAFCGEGNRDPERLSNLPKTTQLINGSAGT